MTYETFVRLIADGAVVPVVLIGAYMLIFKIPNNKKLQAYSQILMAGLTAYLVAKLASVLYQPTDLRPFELLGLKPGASYLKNPGFPSDHALFVTAITLAVWFQTRNKKATTIMAIFVALVCVGRVLALVHSPVDVIFGVIIAFVGALWYADGRKR